MKTKNNNLRTSKDKNFSIGSKVINTALGAASMMGIKPAQRMLKKRATKFAMNKVADGASGIIAAKTGVDKKSIKNIVDGVGQASGISSMVQNKLNSGSMKNTGKNISEKIKNAAASARLSAQRAFGTGPKNTSS